MATLENLIINSGMEDFTLSDTQKDILTEAISSEGIQIDSPNIDDINSIIEIFDEKIQAFKPSMQSSMNLSIMNGRPDWDEFISRLEPRYLESISDIEQQEGISSYLAENSDIRFENWRNRSVSEIVSILDNMEQQIARIEHRPAAGVSTERMNKDTFGYHRDGKIVINTYYLELSQKNPQMLDQMIETLLHEGRHRYQHYNVEERLVHQSAAAVETWRENFEEYGYNDGSPVRIPIAGLFSYTNKGLAQIGARLYYYQPVEIDARVFAADTMSKYHQKINA